MPVAGIQANSSNPLDNPWGPNFYTAPMGSALKGPAFSSALTWAQEQKEQDKALAASQDKKSYLKANIEVMTALLKSVSSNPLESDGVEGIRVLQGLVESISRMQQEDTLKSMDARIAESNFLNAAALVGRKGEFVSHNFKVGTDSQDEVFYEVPSGIPVDELVIELYGPSGGKIAQLEGPKEVGRHDMKNILKNLHPGAYSFQVLGADEAGERVNIQHLVSSRVDSIKKDSSGLMARVGNTFEPLSHLKGVGLLEENETHIVPLPPQLEAMLQQFQPQQSSLSSTSSDS